MAVQPDGQRIWLVSKQRPGGAGARNSAGRNGEFEGMSIHWIPWPDANDRSVQVARRFESDFDQLMVTGMDFSPDGRLAVIRTYFSVHLFVRDSDGSWENCLAGPAAINAVTPVQRQGEAIAFDAWSRSVILTSEGYSQDLWKMPIQFADPPSDNANR